MRTLCIGGTMTKNTPDLFSDDSMHSGENEKKTEKILKK